MHVANNSGSMPCLRALMAGGPGGKLQKGDAGVNAVDEYGKTALDRALEQNYAAEVATILRDELGGKRAADL